jgi:hypothetical protein
MQVRFAREGPVSPIMEQACLAHLGAATPLMLSDWVLRVANLPVYRAVPNMDLSGLRGEVRPLLDAIIESLASDPFMDDEPGEAVRRAAEAHGRLRSDLGVPVGMLLTEIHELRRVATQSLLALGHAGTPVPGRIAERLERSFDLAVVSAAEGWAEPSARGSRLA